MKLKSLRVARDIINGWKASNQVVALTQGVFDLMHYAHLEYLALAASLGNRLVVGIDSDHYVRLRKGRNRPIQNWLMRGKQVLDSHVVDAIYPKSHLFTNRQIVRLLKPHVLVISDNTGFSIKDINFICSNGVRIVLIPRDQTISTTMLISSMHNTPLHGMLRNNVAQRS